MAEAIPRCATCRHWMAPGQQDRCAVWMDWYAEGRLELGVCGACRHVWELDEELPERIREMRRERCTTENAYVAAMNAIGRRELFAAFDGSSYRAGLNTHADFGCVRHEPKTEEK